MSRGMARPLEVKRGLWGGPWVALAGLTLGSQGCLD